MRNDALDIPAFLRRPMTMTIRDRLDKLNQLAHVPSLSAGESVNFNKPKGMDIAEWNEVKKRRAQEKESKHKVHMSRSKLRKQERLAEAETKRATRAALANGARWDTFRNRWITQEDLMPKWFVTPYLPTGETDGIPAPNKRATSSINENADRAELAIKVVAVALRSGKRTSKVEVCDSTGQLLSTWTVDGSDITEGSDRFPLVAQQQEPAVAKSKSKKSKSNAKSVSRKKLNGGPGVIETIVKIISRDRGASIVECVEELKKVFPDRKVSSMTFTVKKQAYLNAKHKERDEKRGMVYYGTK